MTTTVRTGTCRARKPLPCTQMIAKCLLERISLGMMVSSLIFDALISPLGCDLAERCEGLQDIRSALALLRAFDGEAHTRFQMALQNGGSPEVLEDLTVEQLRGEADREDGQSLTPDSIVPVALEAVIYRLVESRSVGLKSMRDGFQEVLPGNLKGLLLMLRGRQLQTVMYSAGGGEVPSAEVIVGKIKFTNNVKPDTQEAVR